METINATDAKNSFGEVLIKAQHSPIGINRNGKPIAVMLSAAEYERYQEDRLKVALQLGLDDVASGRVMDGKDVIKRLRTKVLDAKL